MHRSVCGLPDERASRLRPLKAGILDDPTLSAHPSQLACGARAPEHCKAGDDYNSDANSPKHVQALNNISANMQTIPDLAQLADIPDVRTPGMPISRAIVPIRQA